ncbi:MAG: alpha/beta hydrolase [Roseiarcus sp.]|jgi:hypothetical protein
MRKLVLGGVLLLALQALSMAARAEEVVSLPGGNAVLNAPKSVVASVILVPGGDRQVAIDSSGPHKMLRHPTVFTRNAYAANGVASLLIDANVSVPAAVEYMRRFGKPVVLVGMSNGSLKIMEGLGSDPAGIVLWSGRLQDVQGQLGGSSGPPILVIANHIDHCKSTDADYVDTFKSWGGSRVRVVWVGGGDPSAPDLCRDLAAPHYMVGHEGQVVSAIASFAKSVR